jgi:ABC-type multidrug transport system fused ATPase/permease subunit
MQRPRPLVEFDGVSFVYPAGDGEVVAGISFVLEPGRSVALVGPSGSATSAITRLLLGTVRPSSGVIRVNGREIGSADIGLVRDAVSYLPQEPWLFDGTIADNIAYGRPQASRSEICAAAQAADAHEFISDLPAGYDSCVGRRGRLLSGGQRQRVALARAFLRDSPILVLDEPLTALDPLSADRIVPALRRLMVGRATLVISHHLELAEHSDLVLVLQQGRIVESGSHQWLLANGDIYRQLHRNRAHTNDTQRRLVCA